MLKFVDRLNWCLKHGNLSRADVARWVKRTYPTVNNWFVKGAVPTGPNSERVMARFDQLEKLIKTKRGFPVPEELTNTQRPGYIEKLRDGTERGRVSSSHPSKKRVAVRGRKRKPTSRAVKRGAPKQRVRSARKPKAADHTAAVSA